MSCCFIWVPNSCSLVFVERTVSSQWAISPGFMLEALYLEANRHHWKIREKIILVFFVLTNIWSTSVKNKCIGLLTDCREGKGIEGNSLLKFPMWEVFCTWIKTPEMGTEKKERLVSWDYKKSILCFQLYKENEEERLCFLEALIMKFISDSTGEYLWKMKWAKILT